MLGDCLVSQDQQIEDLTDQLAAEHHRSTALEAELRLGQLQGESALQQQLNAMGEEQAKVG